MQSDLGNIILKGGTEVTIKVNNSHKALGVPVYTRYGITNDGKDVLDMVLDLSKGATRMLIEMKAKIDIKTNMVTLNKPASEGARVTTTTEVNELIRANIVRRVPTQKLKNTNGYTLVVPRRTFMINPSLLIPRTNEDFALARYYWEQLGSIKKEEGGNDESVCGQGSENRESSEGAIRNNVKSDSCNEAGDVQESPDNI